MSFVNPTRLRIGMRGNFGGQEYQVVGRSVLGEHEGGQTYYWHEFNLATGAGDHAILVYDQSGRDTQWRLFTLFEPDYPLTAAAAAAKQVGDPLNLTGENLRVAFCGSSRVYFVEGQAPEGEQVGTRADYFNATARHQMQVVSWTGDEVEFYRGDTLSPGMIASAFRLPPERFNPSPRISYLPFKSDSDDSDSRAYLSGFKAVFIGLLAVIFFFAIFGPGLSCSPHGQARPVTKILAGPSPLALGAIGTLFDTRYRVTAHAVVNLVEVGSQWQQHEYSLTNDAGATALLVCPNPSPGSDWIFYEPLLPEPTLTPWQAAAKKIGDPVELDGYRGKVDEIFLASAETAETERPTRTPNGAVSYGFLSRNGHQTLLARWNDRGIYLFLGRILPAKTVVASFSPR